VIRAGRLRRRIDIQEKVTGRDPDTGEVLEESWVTVWAKCPAAFEPLSSREFIAAKAEQAEATARVVIRYRPGVLPTMRILERGDIYTIVGPPLADPVSGKDYLSILVATGVNDG
jgi:SPP1 family predicted phage head-tail adaptor